LVRILNPAISGIYDESERGQQLLSESWVRFQAANLPAMLSTLLGWRPSGVRDDSEVRTPGLRRAKDLLLGGAAFSTVVAPAHGATAPSRASDGFTPGRSGKMPASDTPLEATVAARLSRFFRNVSTTRLAATIVISALLKRAKRKPRGLHSHSTD
jgi:hypothetical protein